MQPDVLDLRFDSNYESCWIESPKLLSIISFEPPGSQGTGIKELWVKGTPPLIIKICLGVISDISVTPVNYLDV